MEEDMPADSILHNGKIATNGTPSFVEAIAIQGGKIGATGKSDEILRAHRGPATKAIDLRGRTVIPGLNDSHMHVIRGGLTYNTELRWDGVPSLADGLRMLKEQAQRTPPGQWVPVIGGWSELLQSERCSSLAFPSEQALTQHAWPAIIPGFPFIGWLPGRQSAAPCYIPTQTASAVRRR